MNQKLGCNIHTCNINTSTMPTYYFIDWKKINIRIANNYRNKTKKKKKIL